MKHRSYTYTNLIGWIVIVLGFSFLYFSYFFIYIPRQETLVKQRAFRILKEYGSNINDKYNYYKEHFNNYALYYGIRHFGIQPVFSDKKTDSVEVQKVIKGLFPITTELKKTNKDKWSDSFQVDNNRIYLQFHNRIREPVSTRIENLVTKDSLNLFKERSLLTNVPVETFMSSLKFDRLFENILLFDDAQVYYNSNEHVLIDINYPEALTDSIRGMQGGTYLELNIRGEDMHVMILPIHFIGKDFFLAGFIPDSEYSNITRTINNQLLIFLAGLLLLIFIGMPILKVIFLSPNERLKSLDASSSVFSAILGTGLLILLTLSFIKQQFSDNLYHRNRIQLVSDSLYAHVRSDLNDLKNLFSAINALALAEKHPANTSSLVPSNANSALLRQVGNHFLGIQYAPGEKLAESNSKFFQDSLLKGPFPLNEIILINDSGKISQAITRTPFSDLVEIDLNKRKYFTHVNDTSLVWIANDSLKFYIESIQSYNTGKGETAVSFYTKAFGSDVPVLAITSVIPSLYYQVVPNDVEFLIMEESGKVLYHSIKSKNLHENFLEECSSLLKLQKAVDLRVEDNFKLNYNGKNWYARIIPVENTPLYHITLIDQVPSNNKNARIFLFSFYFFVVAVLLLMTGIAIKRGVFPAKKDLPFTWFLKWLDFKSENFFRYKKLIIVLVGAIILQIAGMFFLVKPIAVLFYQFFFMVYVINISMLVLKHRKIGKKHYLYGILFFLLFLSVQVLLTWKPDFIKVLVFLGIIFLSVVLMTNTVTKNLRPGQTNRLSERIKIQKFYLAFLFLLLVNLSVVPVILFYASIKRTEDKLWLQEQLIKVANDNLLLKSVYNDHDASWFKNIQGNDIDFLNVSYNPSHKELSDTTWLSNADKIYLNLFDPVTKSYYPGEFFKGENYTSEWIINDSLRFSKAGREGVVHVRSDGKAEVDYLQLLFVILIACILIVGLIWLLLSYLASVIFNLHPEENPGPDVEWMNALVDPGKKRILLKTFSGQRYYKYSAETLKNRLSKSSYGQNKSEIKLVYISQIIEKEDNIYELLNIHPVIWITGLDNYIYEVDKHDSMLSALMTINQNASQKVIVDLPFDIDLITEYYDEYIAENDFKPEYIARLYTLRKKWQSMFRNYFEFYGYIKMNPCDDAAIGGEQQVEQQEIVDACQKEFFNDQQTLYNVIWENLSGKEKIVLFDLADDGLLNRKNKSIIRRLIKKKLIVVNGNLELFSSGFHDFILEKLSTSQVKVLENKLGLKGQWHNIKYLVLLILIPLAVFIFMSQGISMEKVFGIIGGALAAITALLRLFDSSSFKQAAS